MRMVLVGKVRPGSVVCLHDGDWMIVGNVRFYHRGIGAYYVNITMIMVASLMSFGMTATSSQKINKGPGIVCKTYCDDPSMDVVRLQVLEEFEAIP